MIKLHILTIYQLQSCPFTNYKTFVPENSRIYNEFIVLIFNENVLRKTQSCIVWFLINCDSTGVIVAPSFVFSDAALNIRHCYAV